MVHVADSTIIPSPPPTQQSITNCTQDQTPVSLCRSGFAFFVMLLQRKARGEPIVRGAGRYPQELQYHRARGGYLTEKNTNCTTVRLFGVGVFPYFGVDGACCFLQTKRGRCRHGVAKVIFHRKHICLIIFSYLFFPMYFAGSC